MRKGAGSILASIATIPGRELACAEVVKALEPQVTTVIVADGSERGDAAKFDATRNGEFNYYLTCDDDIIYPANYVAAMIAAVNRHGGRCVVTAHGRSFIHYPIESYYRSPAVKSRMNYDEIRDVPVDIPGTGCMAWRSDLLTFEVEDFAGHKNMADIWAACRLKRDGIEAISIARPAHWLIANPLVDLGGSIYDVAYDDDQAQTDAVNEWFR